MSNTELCERFKGKRIAWTDDELRLTLAYYYFIYEYKKSKQAYECFTNDLKKMTENNRSYGSVGMRLTNFLSIDPRKSAKGFKGGDKKCKPIWDQSINYDISPKESFVLMFIAFIQKYGAKKGIYDDFLKKYSYFLNKKGIDIDDEDGIVTTDDINYEESAVPLYGPEVKPELICSVTKKYKRDTSKAKRAIIISNYKCCLDSNHVSFVSNLNKQYMEAHHLIPLCEQGKFDNSLDVEANIVSLCPNCHRKLHFGKNIEPDIEKLYLSRKELLSKSGIEITLKEVLDLYK